ncbi:TIGR04150 pseudo-rSAM protein [candidate division FCPU426 bacterium]|nr:TIGR04150 pseudo-rSAM protein [candidate division FCPU426 bacterium]
MLSHWLTLEPYVHAACKQGQILLYNPLNGQWRIYILSEGTAFHLLGRLLAPENMRVLEITGSEYASPACQRVISELRGSFMGDCIPAAASQGKPVQLPPRPYIDADIRRAPQPLENCRQNLRELVLYLHSGCRLSCSGCQAAYRQFTCCTKLPNSAVLSLDRLGGLLAELSSYPLERLHLLGGNLLEYPEWDKLPKVLANRPWQVIMYFHPEHICLDPAKLASLAGLKPEVRLVVFETDSSERLAAAVMLLKQLHLSWKVQWVVASREQAQIAQQAGARLGFCPQLLPFYDGSNIPFFQECVFLGQEDITGSRPQPKTIYANMLLNQLAFGRLTILPDGQVYSSLHAPSLGRLGVDGLHVFIERELKNGRSWLTTRASVAPCQDCVWAALCPPITEYEHVLGRHNLCRVNHQASVEMAGASV